MLLCEARENDKYTMAICSNKRHIVNKVLYSFGFQKNQPHGLNPVLTNVVILKSVGDIPYVVVKFIVLLFF